MVRPKAPKKTRRYKIESIGSKIIKNGRIRSTRSFIPLKEYRKTFYPPCSQKKMIKSDGSSSTTKEDSSCTVTAKIKLESRDKFNKPQCQGIVAKQERVDQIRYIKLKNIKEKKHTLEKKPIENDIERTSHAALNKNHNRVISSPVNKNRKLTKEFDDQKIIETGDILRTPLKRIVDNNFKRKVFSFNEVTNKSRPESPIVGKNVPEINEFSNDRPKSVFSNLSMTTLKQNEKGTNKNKKSLEIIFKIYIKEVDMYCSDIAKYSDLYAKRKISLGDYLRLRQTANARHHAAKEKLEQAFLIFKYKPEFNVKLPNYYDELTNAKGYIKEYDFLLDKGCLTDNCRVFVNQSVSTDSYYANVKLYEDKDKLNIENKGFSWRKIKGFKNSKKCPGSTYEIENQENKTFQHLSKATRRKLEIQQEIIQGLIRDNKSSAKKLKLEIGRRQKLLKRFATPRYKKMFCGDYKCVNNDPLIFAIKEGKNIHDSRTKTMSNFNQSSISPINLKMGIDTDIVLKMYSSPNFSLHSSYKQYDTSLSIKTLYIYNIILDCVNNAADKAIEKISYPSRYNLLIKQLSSMLDNRNKMINNLKSKITAMIADSTKEKKVHTEINGVILQNDTLNMKVEMINNFVNKLNQTTKARDNESATHNEKVSKRVTNIRVNFPKRHKQRYLSTSAQTDESPRIRRRYDVSSQTFVLNGRKFQNKDLEDFYDTSSHQKMELDKFKTANELLIIQYQDFIERSNKKENKRNQSLSVIRDLVNEHIKNVNIMKNVYIDKEAALITEIATLRDRCAKLTVANRRLYMRNNEQACNLISQKNKLRSKEKMKKCTKKNCHNSFDSFTCDHGIKLKLHVPATTATVSIVDRRDRNKYCLDLCGTCKKILALQQTVKTVGGAADLTEYQHLAECVVNGVEMLVQNTLCDRYETIPNQITMKYESPNISNYVEKESWPIKSLTKPSLALANFPPTYNIDHDINRFPGEIYPRTTSSDSNNNYPEYNSDLADIYERINQPQISIYDNLADSINYILINVRDDDNIQNLLQNMTKLLKDYDNYTL